MLATFGKRGEEPDFPHTISELFPIADKISFGIAGRVEKSGKFLKELGCRLPVPFNLNRQMCQERNCLPRRNIS